MCAAVKYGNLICNGVNNLMNSGKRLLVRQLEVVTWGPLQGKTRGGESERGRMGKSLGEGHLHFGANLMKK